jgi:putative flippase GtrA
MSRWRNESALLSRFLSTGVLNTVVGFTVIFVLMALNVAPTHANVCGYFVGLVLGFVTSKKFVFRSNGHFRGESIRYLVAFAISFLFNFLVLDLMLHTVGINAFVAQLCAAMSFTLLMFILTRFFVFGNNLTSNHSNR